MRSSSVCGACIVGGGDGSIIIGAAEVVMNVMDGGGLSGLSFLCVFGAAALHFDFSGPGFHHSKKRTRK